MAERMIGIIGGSGLYAVDGLEGASSVEVETPWGASSGPLTVGRIAGVPVAFLPRHGAGHRLPPSAVNYRANIDALKRVGCTEVVSVSAVGSLREDMAPGDFVLVDQYIDRTHLRERSFFGPGCVAHVSLAHPACDRLAAACAAALPEGIRVHRGATYVAIEGPQFSTLAESRLYRAWGADVIGMTGMPEARLAREAELCYLCVAMVTDYDCWHEDHGAVEVTDVLRVLHANADAARGLVARLPAMLGPGHVDCPRGCGHALDHAVMTDRAARDPSLVARLGAVAGRVL
jgi:5'-methylthioadenosine phosphorylase